MPEAKFWTLKHKCQGVPKLTDFQCQTEDLAATLDGEFTIEAEWLSVDPYMRYRISSASVGDTIFGSQVARVVESRNEEYPVGTYVVSYCGWRTRTKLSAADTKNKFTFHKLHDMGTVRRSAALGLLGMPGLTALFGLTEICHPVAGETVVVNAAAGAVGSAVCQIALIKGCRVVAFAGTASKVSYVESLGVTKVHNYKTEDISAALTASAPDGVDCYFDNVGGSFTEAVMGHLNTRARVSVCGAISTYNEEGGSRGGPFNSGLIIVKELRIEGFIVSRWQDRAVEGVQQLLEWLQQGKLKNKETVMQGFDHMPEAFIGLFSGDNIVSRRGLMQALLPPLENPLITYRTTIE